MKRLIGWTLSGALATLLILVLAIIANLWTYTRLTHETVVGDIAFQQLSPGRFVATLTLPDEPERRFVLEGDEWQLDARVLKWEAWVNLLGRHTLFELDRLSGRYSDIQQARTNRPSLHPLRDDDWFDLWAWARRHPDFAFMVDAGYGSSVFLPMYDKAHYRVSLSTTGMLARPLEINEP